MRLSRYLEPELVVIGLDTEGVEDTVIALVRRLEETGTIPEADPIVRAVLERERSHTTSLGNGVALPHATVAGVDRPLILIATAPHGIAFGPAPGGDGSTGEPAADRLFFLLVSPLDAAGRHIKILARIVRLVRRPSFVEALLAASNGAEIIAEIEREDALHV